ncbi:MAG: protoporphyrinogen oxidase HemJ [Mariprofundaceae bacterium]
MDYLSFEWIKAFHIIAMVSWFAGLFYLPRIFVYHAGHADGAVHEQFIIMERKLYLFIMRPAMLVTVILGIILTIMGWDHLHDSLWFWLKVGSVLLLLLYHHYCGYLIGLFAAGANTRSHKFYRLFNEGPTLILLFAVILVVVKPW